MKYPIQSSILVSLTTDAEEQEADLVGRPAVPSYAERPAVLDLHKVTGYNGTVIVNAGEEFDGKEATSVDFTDHRNLLLVVPFERFHAAYCKYLENLPNMPHLL